MTVIPISLSGVFISLIPAIAVVAILYRWRMAYREAMLALTRMLVQLLLVGFLLAWLFAVEQVFIVLAILMFMIVVSSWISLRTVPALRAGLFAQALLSIGVAGALVLGLLVIVILDVSPWYEPRFIVPLAGMFFANAMNSVSLTAERVHTELKRGESYADARRTAFGAGLIPITNSLFAVGLVSLPGMMTGQILAGVSPLIAVRYQIVIMAMVFAAAGLASAGFLVLSRRHWMAVDDA